MKTIHYTNTLRSHLVTINRLNGAVYSKINSKLEICSTLLILRNPNNHYNHGFPNTFDYNHYVYSDYFVCSVTAIAHIIRY